jgi:hypothetical protein
MVCAVGIRELFKAVTDETIQKNIAPPPGNN